MIKVVSWLVLAFKLALVAGVCAICWWMDAPVWLGLIVGALAVAINSALLRWEDDQPGGFNNPR